MTSQDLKLDHFKFYDVANQQAGQWVGLLGQFDRQPERAQLTYLNMFANPVEKNGEPLYDKNAHLTWYDLFDPVPDPVRAVWFTNQFGNAQKIYIGRACALLVPTEKIESGSEFPERLDHFKVYQVLQSDPFGSNVKLKDQFGGEDTKITNPMFFAVPVKKLANGQTYGISNDYAHLVLYRLIPQVNQKTIRTRDQFGGHYIHVVRSVLLGVPSKKDRWEEV